MPAKLSFFRDVAHILGKFLTGFQTDSPVMPFWNDSLEVIGLWYYEYVYFE